MLTSATTRPGAEKLSSSGNHCSRDIENDKKKNLQRAAGKLLFSQIWYSLQSKCSRGSQLAALRNLAHPEITFRRTSKTGRRRTSKELLGCCCGVGFLLKRQVGPELAALRNLAHPEITVRGTSKTTRRRTSNELLESCCSVRFGIPYKASAHRNHSSQR